MMLKPSHSDQSLCKTRGFDIKLIELFTVLFVLIIYSNSKYKLNNVVTYLSIKVFLYIDYDIKM